MDHGTGRQLDCFFIFLISFVFQNHAWVDDILSFLVKTLTFCFLSKTWINVFLLYHNPSDAVSNKLSLYK